MISANKQNLLLLKSQKTNVGNSLKLLVEKRNGLISLFIKMATDGKRLEYELQSKWSTLLNKYKYNTAYTNIESLRSEISSIPSLSLKIIKKRVSGVYIKSLKLNVIAPKRPTIKQQIAGSLEEFALIFPEYIKLAEVKLNTQAVSNEIIKTGRQIRNIENIQEDILMQIKYISNALSEQENQKKATLISIFKP